MEATRDMCVRVFVRVCVRLFVRKIYEREERRDDGRTDGRRFDCGTAASTSQSFLQRSMELFYATQRERLW